MSDHLVNSWENVLLSSVDGDPIVALTWLHNGVKLALHVEMVTLRELCSERPPRTCDLSSLSSDLLL